MLRRVKPGRIIRRLVAALVILLCALVVVFNLGIAVGMWVFGSAAAGAGLQLADTVEQQPGAARGFIGEINADVVALRPELALSGRPPPYGESPSGQRRHCGCFAEVL